MRHIEGRHKEVAQRNGLSLLDIAGQGCGYFLGDTIVAVDAHMYFMSSIDRQRQFSAHRAYRLNMVGMVVRNKNMVNLLQADSILLAILAQTSQAHANIYN
jgi:hypothetical protein